MDRDDAKIVAISYSLLSGYDLVNLFTFDSVPEHNRNMRAWYHRLSKRWSLTVQSYHHQKSRMRRVYRRNSGKGCREPMLYIQLRADPSPLSDLRAEKSGCFISIMIEQASSKDNLRN
jgi:hypothetical protein